MIYLKVRKQEIKCLSFETSVLFFLDNYQANGYALFILFFVYMAIISILLVNLLIAMLRY